MEQAPSKEPIQQAMQTVKGEGRPNVALDPVKQTAVFRNAGERARYLQDLFDQGVVPTHYKTLTQLENAFKILNQLGLNPELHLNKLYYVGSQLTVMGEPLLTACRATGLLEYITWTFVNDKNEVLSEANLVGFKVSGCICKAKRKDEVREVMFGFTLEEAEQAGLTQRNKNYRAFAKDMLMWRATGRVLRMLFSEICGGIPIQGVDDLVAMTDSEGKLVRTDEGHTVYQHRQQMTQQRLQKLLGNSEQG